MGQRYAAFLSYSHHDRAAARRVQAAVEAYRVPESLVGTPGAHGPVPPRLRPVFRDEADLAASGDLSASVAQALDQSDALVVLCSPAAAQSAWVAEEVRRFKARAGPARVFALVIAGTPFAADGRLGDPAQECLPLPLRRVVTPAGEVTQAHAEPLVADIHAAGGAHHARLRLMAGLLGVPADSLVHREHGRRTRRLLGLAAALALALALTGALALMAVRGRDAAREERAQAERLISFMLGDLRGRLETVGRLDLMDAVALQTLRYYERQDSTSFGADSLAQRAQALRLLGELRMTRGDLPAAQRAFAEAAATTGELVTRAPGDGQRLFDHAQSEFWLGNVAFERGNLAEAETHFRAYAQASQQLVALDPERADWRAELGHGRVNLGAVAMRRRDWDAAATLFEAAVPAFREARWRDPKAASAYDEAQALAWQADAQRYAGYLVEARAAREAEAKLYEDMLVREPSDAPAQAALAWSWQAQALLALDTGEGAAALDLARRAVAANARLVALEPANVEWAEARVAILRTMAEAQAATGDRSGAFAALDSASRASSALLSRDPERMTWRLARASVLVTRGELAAESGAGEAAARDGRGALALTGPPEALPDIHRQIGLRARLLAAPGDTARLAGLLPTSASRRLPAEQCLAARLAALSGDRAAAQAAISALRATGYRKKCDAMVGSPA